MNLKEKILEFTSDNGVLYKSEELVDFIKSLINDKINKTIEKIESETLFHYAYEEVIVILEDLKIEEHQE